MGSARRKGSERYAEGGAMVTFLGIGAGPIQTGIFVSGAVSGGFSRIVLADVDRALVEAVRSCGSITVNTAERNSVRSDTFTGVEIYNPADPADLETLKKVAGEARVVCMALPSTAFYGSVAPWLGCAFRAEPELHRFVYAAENSTTAADELRDLVGEFPNTHYLDTVIGKMSKVFAIDGSDLPPLVPGFERGHLVEAFNQIYTDSAPGIENVGIAGLYPKADLHPFEEAKLYGHNTAHFLLASMLEERGCSSMDEAVRFPDCVEIALSALIDECGVALCSKHEGKDVFFEPDCFRGFAESLVDRMISPNLKDNIGRVVRDPVRKLGWNDRMIGAIRLCIDQKVEPTHLLAATAVMMRASYGQKRESTARYVAQLWKDVPALEANRLIKMILHCER